MWGAAKTDLSVQISGRLQEQVLSSSESRFGTAQHESTCWGRPCQPPNTLYMLHCTLPFGGVIITAADGQKTVRQHRCTQEEQRESKL